MLPIADDPSLLPRHFLQTKFMLLAMLTANILAVIDYFSGVLGWIGGRNTGDKLEFEGREVASFPHMNK